MAATVNERLHDAAINHAIDLHQYSNAMVAKIVALLNRVDPDIAAQIMLALEKLPPESFTVDRLDQVLSSVRSLNVQAYYAVDQELRADLHALVEYEANYQYQLFRSTIPAQILLNVDIAKVGIEQVYSAVASRPFQGRILSEWASSIEIDRMVRIRDAIRIGYVGNEPIAKIVQRIRGTRAQGYSDGIIAIDRRNAEAVVRTAISHTAAMTRDRFYDANIDIIKFLIWTATLDSRTSEGCRIRDGLQYTPDTHKPVGHSIPWLGGPGALHWNCRSVSLPVLRSAKELGGADIPSFTPSTRAAMDGTVPAETTYADWIKNQSAARQDEILGPSRGKLMRSGGLELDRFYSDKGKYLTLDELRLRDAAAFARAGV